jgi:hypothetical protein
MVGVKPGTNTWSTCYDSIKLNLIVLGDIHLILVCGCDRQGLGDKELSAHLKGDRETTEVKEVVIKLRGARKFNCENMQECR